ncbi:phytoene/squalene synthase family protein [Halomicrococcus sp. SG-WS-1]|uniref:phytoene/squalene synthase family protein n=1 Tax=Halomicrococcus sp. SG-WS-1 TaxID=3439057 RepID=UPI003F7AA374
MDGRTSTTTFDDAHRADLDWCHDAVQGVSRTFAITIDLLEAPMADAIGVGYLLCRVADTIEDAGHVPPDEQAELLRLYARVLDPDDPTDATDFSTDVEEWIPDDGGDDWDVVANAPRIVATFETRPASVRSAVRPPVRELVGGMATFVDEHSDAGGLRIGTVEELEEYCYYVAGTVGELVTNLVSRDADREQVARMRETAESFALLLQLVNVAKDVHADYHEENNVYLPASWLEAHGVPQDDLCDPEHAEAVAAVVERTAERAESYADDALAYLEAMPETKGNRLVAWVIPFLLAVGTLREVQDRPGDALRREGIKVDREEVHALMVALSDGVEREAIADLRATVAETPFHRA